jgi:hypothetical protein
MENNNTHTAEYVCVISKPTGEIPPLPPLCRLATGDTGNMEFKVHHRTVLHLSLANSFFFLQLYPFPPSIGGHAQCKTKF